MQFHRRELSICDLMFRNCELFQMNAVFVWTYFIRVFAWDKSQHGLILHLYIYVTVGLSNVKTITNNMNYKLSTLKTNIDN